MTDNSFERFLEATFIGFLSAVSLMLGSWLGLTFKPTRKVAGIFAAFGGGALIAASTVELIAPVAERAGHDEHGNGKRELLVAVACTILGSLAFILLDQLVSRHGGFLRGYIKTLSYYAQKQQYRTRMLGALVESPLFGSVPVDELKIVAAYCKPVHFISGIRLFHMGSEADRMYFIESGKVEEGSSNVRQGCKACIVGRGGLTGEVGILNSERHHMTATARTNVDAFMLSKKTVEIICARCPTVTLAIRAFCVKKLESVVKIERMNTHWLQVNAIEKVKRHSGLRAIFHPVEKWRSPNLDDIELNDLNLPHDNHNGAHDSSTGTLLPRSVSQPLSDDAADSEGSPTPNCTLSLELARTSLDCPEKSDDLEPQEQMDVDSPKRWSKNKFVEGLGFSLTERNPLFNSETSVYPKEVSSSSPSTPVEQVDVKTLTPDRGHHALALEDSALVNGANVAPLAVWLGILLDGIPESIVLGTNYLAATNSEPDESFFSLIPHTLIAGLFLSNFPEALSSSIGMYNYGWSKTRVFLMWTSLTVMTSLGAGFGYAVGSSWSESLIVGVQGIAAGAMLTMIASTMIPEAYETCGPTLTGFFTLLGFSVAVSFKVLE
eukprot:CAMPEP_0198232860 /NCGR_PEP_ID=MMETSP1445-20131203/115945_1 /TAXON_ID=36898 /ORGANISM="Pyramimonas sp., Strain CCMP2087" /LENGTH=606 /DNA_ID=CAMNT_0043913547 /DNA_START=649 /DNA_END=2472 /DNA_ORIENTATION=+